jgi:hypothetical protein
MHPTVCHYLAQARIADLRHQAQRDTLARAARRPDRRRTTQTAPPRPPLPASRRFTTRGKVMTRTLQERPGLPGSAGIR